MAIRKTFWCVLWLACFQATGLRADCGVIGAIERIAAAHLRVIAQPSGPALAYDIALIRQELARLDPHNVEAALRPSNLPTQTTQLTGYMADLGGLPPLLQKRDEPVITSFLFTISQNGGLGASVAALPAYDCDDRVTRDETQPDGDLIRGSNQLRSENGAKSQIAFQVNVYLTTILTVFLASLAIGGLWHWRRTVRQQHERRGKRFTTNIPAYVRLNRKTGGATIMDVSCRGAKLKYDPAFNPKPGQVFHICYEARWIPATISWANQHYCGVHFETALSLADLSVLISPNYARRQAAAVQTKTAPEPRTPLPN